MTKRRLFRWSLILITLAAFAVWLEPTRVVWGWLRGEAFYQGRPASWWANELGQWEVVFCDATGRPLPHQDRTAELVVEPRQFIFRRKERFSWLSKLWTKANSKREFKLYEAALGSTLLYGEPEAAPVLCELAESPDSHVRRQAKYGIYVIELLRKAKESRYTR
jgi:hypothetical protein